MIERMTHAEHAAIARSRRRSIILEGALRFAERDGWHAIQQKRVADEAGVSKGLVTHEFGSMGGLKTAMMEEAVARFMPKIVAAGLAEGHPVAQAAPAALREAAARSIA